MGEKALTPVWGAFSPRGNIPEVPPLQAGLGGRSSLGIPEGRVRVMSEPDRTRVGDSGAGPSSRLPEESIAPGQLAQPLLTPHPWDHSPLLLSGLGVPAARPSLQGPGREVWGQRDS